MQIDYGEINKCSLQSSAGDYTVGLETGMILHSYCVVQFRYIWSAEWLVGSLLVHRCITHASLLERRQL
ncbi:hypothetical protein MKW98_016635 [Papaver atlanticum]|uniref:Uncharacterized protein n=1 Tax=Papaver atlanticum TaxID=357466 RepID=A0AAD4SRZ7_9MAGN|nr:hypothetical protein MKW98_016635 [Papaver atlanticum]